MKGIIDTHSHLQSESLAPDLDRLIETAREAGVSDIVICAGGRNDWGRCKEIAHRYGLSYMLGIHPLYTPHFKSEDLAVLDEQIASALDDEFFVGIGEIGIEGMVKLDDELQESVFAAQLRLAKKYGLPVSVHVRKSASRLLKYLRRIAPVTGVIHAFNGSDVEREAFLKLGFKLGFGGAATYDGSKRIRRHLSEVPSSCWVLETDAPDMPSSRRRDAGSLRTEPADISETARLAAQLRGIPVREAVRQSRENALQAFPRLALKVSRKETGS